ncbi:MAG: hypothetical protein QOC60_705 [Frankiaceae bacterium]|jgi:uncharacterized membrane protein|nr:hypothetical protein [Frankiaceae bacterium]
MASHDETIPPTNERRSPEGEHRWPAAIAVLLAILMYALLSNPLLVGPRWVVPVLGVLLLVPLVATNPRRLKREVKSARITSIVLVVLLALANMSSLVRLIVALLDGSQKGAGLLLGALQVWLTNIIVFGLAYWEIDRGGPVVRTQRSRDDLPDADFRFPHDENVTNVREVSVTSSAASGWVPHFIDYLYVSVTNSSAFSPTDTMPLSTRAKCLMGFQSLTAFVISVLVIARAVSLVGS